MQTPQHTPGPWLTGHDGHGGMYVEDSQQRQVGFVSARRDQESNASLIAAAPELLEALQAIADPTVRVDGRFAAFAIDRFRKIAIAAIAKATGAA